MTEIDRAGPIGQPARKVKGYQFPGEIRSVYTTRSGKLRYVVEATGADYAGMQHIFNADQLGRDAEADRPFAARPAPVVDGAIDWNKQFYYPIVMPLDETGQGPASEQKGEVRKITWEVWDRYCNAHGTFDYLLDAINEAERLNATLTIEAKPPQHSEQLAKHLKVAANDLKSRPSELRGPFNIKPLNALPEKGEGDTPDPAYMAANAEMHEGVENYGREWSAWKPWDGSDEYGPDLPDVEWFVNVKRRGPNAEYFLVDESHHINWKHNGGREDILEYRMEINPKGFAVSTSKPTVDMEPVAWTQPSCLSLAGGTQPMWNKRDMDDVRAMINDPDCPDDVPLYSQAQVDALQAKVEAVTKEYSDKCDQFLDLILELGDARTALEEIATNHANGATFSGTDCAEIAREALKEAGNES